MSSLISNFDNSTNGCLRHTVLGVVLDIAEESHSQTSYTIHRPISLGVFPTEDTRNNYINTNGDDHCPCERICERHTGGWYYPARTGGPACRFGHTAVVIGGHMIVFGGRGDQYYNDTWCYDLAAKCWVPGGERGRVPSPRAGHTAIRTSRGTMLVFGGSMDDNTCTNDLYEYHPAQDTWKKCHLASSTTSVSKRGFPIVRPTNYAPSPPILSVGGVGGIRSYEPPALPSTQYPLVSVRAKAPKPRKGHTALPCGERHMVLYGGRNTTPTADKEVWVLDYDSMKWRQLKTHGTAPGARYYHCAEMTDTGKMLVFGGKCAEEEEVYLDDLYELDLRSLCGNGTIGYDCVWRRLETRGPTPSPRMCSSSLWLNGALCIFVGSTGDLQEDSYQLNYTEMTWTRLHLSNAPQPSSRPTTVYDAKTNTVTMFGGQTAMDEYIDNVAQLKLEAPSLKECCREWMRSRYLHGSSGESVRRCPLAEQIQKKLHPSLFYYLLEPEQHMHTRS